MKKLILNEDVFSSRPDAIRRSVYEHVMDTIDDAFDAFAQILAEKVPGYNPDWADSDGSTKQSTRTYNAQEAFAMEMTNLLLANMNK